MTTTDPYRLDGLDGLAGNTDPAQPDSPREGVTWDGFARTALWLVLVISTVGNMVASYSTASTQVHLVCGAVTGLSASVLVVRHLRGRR
ncbi:MULTISPECIES: hypothetical protein [Streptomyces]|uniref:hypothetical protein n=1 Tax=Streptomyces TaxID=1883 RepID=UPI002010A2FE|nr:hypothetical protein [Streptomyces sp. LRE541]UPZ29675.1 hypothetical protein MUK60_18845 [Streptomyces sp. LRE541]